MKPQFHGKKPQFHGIKITVIGEIFYSCVVCILYVIVKITHRAIQSRIVTFYTGLTGKKRVTAKQYLHEYSLFWLFTRRIKTLIPRKHCFSVLFYIHNSSVYK